MDQSSQREQPRADLESPMSSGVQVDLELYLPVDQGELNHAAIQSELAHLSDGEDIGSFQG